MTGKRKTLFVRTSLAAALALAACVGLSPRAALAKYMSDGAAQDAITGGWNLPTDMVCITGVHMNGNLDIAAGVTSSRDCIYRNTGLTGLNPVDVTAASTCGSTGLLACGVAANCTGTSAVTKGTLTWNATDLKCYDSAPCTVANFAGGSIGGVTYPANDGAKHALATSICVDSSGNGLSLTGVDRTAQMCAEKLGTWKQTSATAPPGFPGTFPTAGYGGSCVAYTRQFAGQDANGAPLVFGANGTTQATGTGYCYTSLNFTKANSPNYTATTCPSVGATTAPYNANAAYDWSFTSSQCRYAKGIAGLLPSALTKADGTTYASGSYLDLSTFTTMGDCLANGGTWNNWTGSASLVSVTGTDGNAYKRPGWDYTAQAPDADEGCLHCHSATVEYNGPAERQKDTYLKTGHKNMLRKVTAGKNWAGPCASGDTPNADGLCVYTTDGTNPINFMTGSDPFAKVTVGGVDQNLYYIYGDWMVRNPTLVYGTNGYGPTIGTNNGYSCYACHTTGASDNSNPGVQSIGTPGYAGVEPQASFPGISLNAANPKWNLEGIQCARCHNATVAPVSAAQIAASSFKTTAPTSGGMGALAAGTGRANLCFGCHQSIAKAWPSGATQYDPTLIPTGVSHGAAAGRDFNGHVLGNSFLNSVHAEYAGAQSGNGSITLNSLGKYDLTDPNGTTEYGSLFKGYTCWQSPTTNSPAKTWIDSTLTTQAACEAGGGEFKSGFCVKEIKTKSDCETLYGVGSWRADASGDLGTQQGTCTTCHDVHNSLFIDTQKEAALRKKCADCHVNNSTTGATDAGAPQVVPASINHLQTAGTPFDSTMYDDACVVCHMATQAEANGDQTSMPVHVWRINTSASYSTFPTTGQFYGGTCSVHTGAIQNAPSKPVVYLSDTSSTNCTGAAGTWTAGTALTPPVPQDRNAQVAADGTYAKAVWVDLDLACGQCHGGSLGAGATHNGAPYLSKALLAGVANGMHNNAGLAATVAFTDTVSGLMVNVTQAVSCAGGCPSLNYDWNWGDGTPDGSGATASHTYATPTGTCSNPAYTTQPTCVAGGNQWDPNSNVWPITLTVTLASGGTTNSTVGAETRNVKITAPDNPPTANAICTSNANTWTLTVQDTSTDTDSTPVANVVIDWGDLSMRTVGAPLGTFTHTYLKPPTTAPYTYTATLKAIDSGLLMSPAPKTCTIGPLATFTISGTVKNHASIVNLASAIVQVVKGTLTVKTVYTAGDGTFSAGGLAPGTYTLVVNKPGYTFPVTGPITLGGSSAGNTILAN